MKAILIGTTLCAGLTAWSMATAPDARLEAIKGYRKWKQATNGPQDMTPSLALSCVGPQKHDRSPNPHNPKVFLVYVNAVGAKAMLAAENVPFPDGTVIVKEKYDRARLQRDGAEEWWESVDVSKVKAEKPEFLTVMAKKNGTWTYYAVGADGKVAEGDTGYCADCHETVKKADYVFRPYAAETRYITTKRR